MTNNGIGRVGESAKEISEKPDEKRLRDSENREGQYREEKSAKADLDKI